MSKIFGRLLTILASSLGLVFTAHAAAPSYEGKTIKLIVGFSAEGGFDTYSRADRAPFGKTYSRQPGNCRSRLMS
jgi:tripartite-type tricarboxylate transporter receptor subunit TctC